MESDDGRSARRWALGLAVVPFVLPNLSAAYWAAPAALPPLFSTGMYREYLRPNATVIAPLRNTGRRDAVAGGETDVNLRFHKN